MCKKLVFLSLNDLCELSLGTFMFKQVKNTTAIVIDDIVRNRDMRSYFTRNARIVHTTRNLKVAKSFLNMGIAILV